MVETALQTEKDTERPDQVRGSGVAFASGMVSNGRNGRFVSCGGLTEKQAEFVRHFVSNGGDKRSAVELSGYNTSYPVQVACHLLQRPNVQAALRLEREKYIAGDLASIALNTMRDLLADKATPAATRFQAAKWSLETAGHGRKDAVPGLPDPDKPLSQMSLTELETFISAGRQALERPTIEGQADRLEHADDDVTDIELDDDNAQDSARIEDMMRVDD